MENRVKQFDYEMCYNLKSGLKPLSYKFKAAFPKTEVLGKSFHSEAVKWLAAL
jgi:hypothetical protein